MNYTKGEWKARSGIRTDKDFICATNGTTVPPEEELANCHLICAAPAMYEALRAISSYELELPSEIVKQMWEALARAEGKAQ